MPLSTNLETSIIIEKDDIKKIFSNIEIIWHLHRELLSDLNAVDLKIGSVFKKRLPFMSIYSNYGLYLIIITSNIILVLNWRTSASTISKYKDSKAYNAFKKVYITVIYLCSNFLEHWRRSQWTFGQTFDTDLLLRGSVERNWKNRPKYHRHWGSH
jgi:hypothetical protein